MPEQGQGTDKLSIEDQLGKLGWGQPAKESVNPTGTYQQYRPRAQPTSGYKPYQRPGDS